MKLLLTLLLSSTSFAMPAQIVIFRNAEKIRTGYELNERGWERAYGLVSFIKNNRHMSRYGKPVAVYAVSPDHNISLIRMKQTVIPLSQDLRIPIQSAADSRKLVEMIKSKRKYDGKTIVICWENEKIPELVRTFGLKRGSREWQDAYDRVWVLRYQNNKLVEFRDLPQKLLKGDSRS